MKKRVSKEAPKSLDGLLLDVEWGLRMLTESATPEALDVPQLLERIRVSLVAELFPAEGAQQ